MYTTVKLYSNKKNEIFKFLNSFYNFNKNIHNTSIQTTKDSYSATNKNIVKTADLEWENTYQNPIEIVDIIGVFIENNDKYKINMWICIDDDVYINVTEQNANELIRYLYERFPY